MPLSILNVGPVENETLLHQLTTAEEEPPVVRSLSDLAEAHVWAGMHTPDVVIIDLHCLNDMNDGTDFIERFSKNLACSNIPLLAIADGSNRNRALLAGATEVIIAPLSVRRCRARLLSALRSGAQRRLRRYQSQWFDKGSSEPIENDRAQEEEILSRFLRAGEFGNKDSNRHAERVGKISRRIAEALGCPESECDTIEIAAHIHDIGKLGIPNSILHKCGPLTKEERKTMETHTRLGFDMLKNGRSPHLQYGALMALAHHERFDGNGYPNRIRGEEIPLCARIVAVADAYDALKSHQPYKLAWTDAKVHEHLNQQKGKHFDPQRGQAIAPHVQSAMDIQ